MNGQEMRATRKRIALTQHELAQRLGVSRKTIVGWEASDTALDEGIALQILQAAGQIRLVENVYWIDVTKDGSYAVINRRIRTFPTEWAANYTHGATMLFGVFKRRDHAYRWCAALQSSADPRYTRRLIKQRAAELAVK
jgi:DNA-binding XRE family transcriptional regulator